MALISGTRLDPKTAEDVMQVELNGQLQVTPLVQSAFAARNGVVSPNGRWLAYETNVSGQFEIHVRPYPDVAAADWAVSTTGGTRPRWSRGGQELFYVSPSGALMRIFVEQGTSWGATPPTLVVKEGYFTISPVDLGITYDISADGQRFLMVKEGRAAPLAALAGIVVVQHWGEELKRLVPTK